MAAKKKASAKVGSKTAGKTTKKAASKKTATKAAVKKAATKKATKATAGKAAKKPSAKTTKKSASAAKGAAKSSRAVASTVKKKTTGKKTMKKTATKTTKTATKKATASKTAKTQKKASSAKTAAPAEKKTAKKVVAKEAKPAKAAKAPKAASGKKAKPVPGASGVTVQFGGGKPKLSLAPGVMISQVKVKKPEEGATVDSTAHARKLTKKELTKIREELIEKRAQLLHGMRRELADYRERSGHKSFDEADQAADAYDESLSFEIASTSDQELEEIETAIDKIDNGTYGKCEECDAPISPSRLKILPFAVNCRRCRIEKEQVANSANDNSSWNSLGRDSDSEEE
ncbi:MAG: TraR/DksA C4-type zinc finger protein [Planctomycetes bacterium]|nr:TraR/DksA C4-type zinc finger protein [Planctomycetota bacterium]